MGSVMTLQKPEVDLRKPGASVRVKLTLSYAGFLVLISTLLLALVWVFLLRYVPAEATVVSRADSPDGHSIFFPGRYDLIRAFVPVTLWTLLALLAVGLVGGSGEVHVVIENTGEIVDPAVLSTLTEPFQRGTERVRGDQAGAGLGLAIVKSIVRAHDGTLEITARPSGGLKVTVRLPS